MKVAVNDGDRVGDGTVGLVLDEHGGTVTDNLEAAQDDAAADLSAKGEAGRDGGLLAVLGLALELERRSDGQRADGVRSVAVGEGDLGLAGADGVEQVIDGGNDELGGLAVSARRQDREGALADGGLGVVDVVLTGVGVDVHGVAARVEHPYHVGADDIRGLVGGVGLAAEHHRVAGRILDGLPADGQVLGVTGGDGGRLDGRFGSRQGGVDLERVERPGELRDADGAGGIDIDEGLAGDVADEYLLGVAHQGEFGCSALDGDARTLDVADADDHVGAAAVNRLYDYRTGAVNLEGEIAVGRYAALVGDGRVLEVKGGVVDVHRLGLDVHQEAVADLGLGDVAHEVLGVAEVPGVRTGQGGERQVLGLLHVRGPPFRGSGPGGCHVGVDEVEEAALGVEARVGGQLGAVLLEVVGPESGGDVEIEVVGEADSQVVGGVVLGVAASEGGLLGHIEQEVVLEAEAAYLRAVVLVYGDDAGVVGVVAETEVAHRVVLEAYLTPLAVVDAYEGTHSVIDGVVDDVEGVHLAGSAEVHHVAATGAVPVDGVDLTTVPGELAELVGLVPLVDEALGEAVDGTVAVNDAADGDQRTGAAVLQADGMAEGAGVAVDLHAFEVDVASGEVGSDAHDSDDDRPGAVCGGLTIDFEALGDIDAGVHSAADDVGGSGHLEEHHGAVLHTLLEGCYGADLDCG